jgi:hypothetical protein
MEAVLASPWRDRVYAASIHLGLSFLVAAAAAGLVFGLWYPYPYREVSGGRDLFLILIAVDVILGPLITFAIFNKAKSRAALMLDFSVIGALQVAALAYGLATVFEVRPVHLVFEYSRFRVVHAVELADDVREKTPIGIDPLPVAGPTLLSLRPFKDGNEQMEVTLQAIEGLEPATRPGLWQPYALAKSDVLKAGRAIGELKTRFPGHIELIDRRVKSSGRPQEALVYVPMIGRQQFWTVLVDAATAEVVGFLPLDSF